LSSLTYSFFSLIHRPPPRSTLFPYTTLFRSGCILSDLLKPVGSLLVGSGYLVKLAWIFQRVIVFRGICIRCGNIMPSFVAGYKIIRKNRSRRVGTIIGTSGTAQTWGFPCIDVTLVDIFCILLRIQKFGEPASVWVLRTIVHIKGHLGCSNFTLIGGNNDHSIVGTCPIN